MAVALGGERRISKDKTKVKIDINPGDILQEMGLGKDGEARVFLAKEVARLSDPYVPFQSGALKNQRVVAKNGKKITYPGPYAHYQHTGLVMAGRAPKHYTGENLTYQDAPMRGPHWDKRMLADRQDDLVQATEKHIKRKLK